MCDGEDLTGMKTIYLCKDSFENILCAVYDAWLTKGEVQLALDGERNLELFCEYNEVETDLKKAEKVSYSIRKKVSEEAWELVYKASLSYQPSRADAIFRFLKQGFCHGARVTNMLALPEVYDIFSLCRHIDNENHLLMGFVRFSETRDGILFGKIGPKNDVTVLLAPYFADRLSCENWILYDENRHKAAVHKADTGWIMVNDDMHALEAKLGQQTDEAVYRELWAVFHKSISIRERENPVCQRNHLPLRYRPYMTEFHGKP